MSTIATTTIKTLIDLVSNLHDRIKDRKFAAEISQIQSLIFSVQKENSSLVSENLDLKKKIFELEQQHAHEITQLQEKHVEEKAPLTDEITKLKQQISDMQKEPDMGSTSGAKLMAHRPDSPFNE